MNVHVEKEVQVNGFLPRSGVCRGKHSDYVEYLRSDIGESARAKDEMKTKSHIDKGKCVGPNERDRSTSLHKINSILKSRSAHTAGRSSVNSLV